MSQLSFRASLAAARAPSSSGRLSFAQHVQASWRNAAGSSLRASFERMLIDPQIASWSVAANGIFENNEWHAHVQGLCCDGSAWYISRSDDKLGRLIVKFSLDFKQELARWDPGMSFGDHIGDIDCGFYRGAPCIYAPFEHTADTPGRLAILSPNLDVIGDAFLKGEGGGPPPTGPKAPWAGFHPGNQLVYTSNYYNVTRLEAYDPHRDFRHVPEESIQLDRALDELQGGAFNGSGHVFLTQEKVAEIWAFSTFTGAFLGATGFEMHNGGVEQEMAEGLCWAPLTINGKRTSLHFTMRDYDVTNGDDLFTKHFETGALE